MPNLFARTTPLPDLAGRLDYIANPDRQENLLAVWDSAEDLLDGQFWSVLAKESQDAFTRSGKTMQRILDKRTGESTARELKCREAREIHMQLSNSLLNRMEPEEIARILSNEFETKLGMPNRVAVHYNKSKTSLHAHIIFPERHFLESPEIKVAERNIYFDAQGKRKYRKSDILDTDGKLMPGCYIIAKGEIYQQRYFSNVDTNINTRAWLKHIKSDVILRLRNGVLRGDLEITEYDPSTGKLAQQYIGPKVDAKTKAKIEAGNMMVRVYNGTIDAGQITHDEAMRIQEEYNHQDDRNAYLAAKLKEIRLRKKREREAREAAENATIYSRPDWYHSTTGIPYRVGIYDEYGRKRTLIELIVMLAIVTIENEHKWMPDRIAEMDIQEFVKNPIHVKKDYKIQAMMDTIRIAREESINKPVEIEERLQEVGKSLSMARAEAKRLYGAKSRMDSLAQAVADYNRLERHCERIYAMPDDNLDKHISMAQYAADLEKYKAAKATLYRSSLVTPEARKEFMERYKNISRMAEKSEREAAELKARYKKLCKLQYHVEIAQNRVYCYNAQYCPRYEDQEKLGISESKTRLINQEEKAHHIKEKQYARE